MAASLAELARLVGGAWIGNGDLPISGAATLVEARNGEISFLDKADKSNRLTHTAASALVAPVDFVPPRGLPAIQVADVQPAFAKIVAFFRPPRERPRIGVSPQAHISPQAKLAADVDVYPGATIEGDVEIGVGATIHSGARIMAGCRIAAGAVIHCNAVLYPGTIIGARSVIHAGVVLGCDGFGYRQADGKHQLCPQLGHVEIGADVEIGANSTVDRGVYGATVVGDGTKLDNLVQIGHNCRIGRHNLICAQVGIAGSTTTGDWVVLAGQVGVADHVHIGSGAVLGAMAGVSKDVPENSRMFGAPAAPERDQKILLATLTKLPEMRHQLKDLSRAVARLEAAAAGEAVHEPHALTGPHQASGASNGAAYANGGFAQGAEISAGDEPATD